MKIFIYCRPRDYTSEDTLHRFLHILEQSGLEFAVNEAYVRHVEKAAGIKLPEYGQLDPKDLEGGSIMISIGGDGTFLDAVRSLGGLEMPIAGVNMGRLGFLAGIAPGDFAAALEEIKKGGFKVVERAMLEASGGFETVAEFPCALNEFYIHRHAADMIEVATYFDGHLVSVIRGDGAIVSTPTGSTAYSLSAGGPLVSPECSCFVFSSIAPHNFSIRPIVVPDNTLIEVEVHSRGKQVLASLDNRSFVVDDGARFTIKKSKYRTFFARIQNISFYDTLRSKIMWGMDKRDSSFEGFWTDI